MCETLRRGLNPLLMPLVVMSEQANTNGGLVLATSPKAKWKFCLQTTDLIVASPRMYLYI